MLFSEKKKVVKYNPNSDKYDWELDFEDYITGISRIDNFVFITTKSFWGKLFTYLVDFNSGKKIWTIDEIFYSIHIIEDILVYTSNKKVYNGLNIKTDENIFSTESPFRWSTPKVILLKEIFYIFTTKKAYILNLNNGDLVESKLPNNLNPKEMILVLDEFQININNLPSAGGDAFAYMGDAGGGDAGGGAGE